MNNLIDVSCISHKSDHTKATATVDRGDIELVVHNNQLSDIQTTKEILNDQTSRTGTIVENRQVI